MASRNRVLRRVTGFSLVIMLAASAAVPAFAQELHAFDVSSNDAATAIHEFGVQSGVQILAAGDGLESTQLNDVSGVHSTEEALDLLLAGSGLTHRYVGERAVALVSAEDSRAASAAAENEGDAGSDSTSPAKTSGGAAPAADAAPPPENPGPQGDNRPGNPQGDLEEIIVTGTHIRGGNLSAPVVSFDRELIERSGYSTTQQLVQSLPQNLNNFSDTTFGEINGGAPGSTGQGSGPNLRGLGGDSTLVLLNGRRLAPAAEGNYVDISLIPLSAVERVEVLTDGASAIYGSDAVAGVVNIILREDLDGAETRVRYGVATEGDSDELQAGQSFGHSWGSGRALLSYEYYSRSPLRAEDRDFVDLAATGALEALLLSPDQERHGVLLSATQELSERVELSGDFLFGRRDSDLAYQIAGLPVIPMHSEGQQASASLGATIGLNDDWQLRTAASFGQNETLQESIVPGLINSQFESRNRLWTLDVGADGVIGQLPGGDLRLGVGGQYREEESRGRRASAGNITTGLDRDVAAAYAELLVPIVGEAQDLPGVRHLELSAAVRFENYSDFGSTTNPKLGVSWAPVGGLNLRATYGRSFKAPLLSELNPASLQPVAYPLIDPASPTGITPGLVLFGSGLALDPEKATTWTAGFDLTPPALEGLTLQATWFEIDFEDRIASPLPSDARLFSVLSDPTVAQFIDRNPDPAFVTELFASPAFLNFAGAAPGDVGAIADARLTNVAESVVRGVDLSATFQAETALGALSMGILGTYLLEDSERLLPGTPVIETIDTVYHQPELRLRANVSLELGAFIATGFVNYTDSYADNRDPALAGPGQRATVGSWTTVDATAIWDLSEQFDSDLLGDTTLTFSALNVFDRDPPFIASTLGIYFDGVNASPMGRWVSLRLARRW